MEKKAKYMEVVDFVKQKMKNKELVPGDKLYSENELSEMFHLSRQTVRHAIGILEDEGIVSRVRGSGTYIQDNCNAELEGRTRIAVVSTYVDSYIFPKTIQGMQSVLFEKGYSVQIAFTNNEVEKEREILEDIIYNEEASRMLIDPKIWNVIREETPYYFEGERSVEETACIIQSRVQIILQE